VGGIWKHVEVGENLKHTYEHGFAPRERTKEEEEGYSRQPVCWVLHRHAAHARGQS